MPQTDGERDRNIKLLEDIQAGKIGLNYLKDFDPQIILIEKPNGSVASNDAIAEALKRYWDLYGDDPPAQRPPSILV